MSAFNTGLTTVLYARDCTSLNAAIGMTPCISNVGVWLTSPRHHPSTGVRHWLTSLLPVPHAVSISSSSDSWTITRSGYIRIRNSAYCWVAVIVYITSHNFLCKWRPFVFDCDVCYIEYPASHYIMFRITYITVIYYTQVYDVNHSITFFS